jgi:hypothetical protein
MSVNRVILTARRPLPVFLDMRTFEAATDISQSANTGLSERLLNFLLYAVTAC